MVGSGSRGAKRAWRGVRRAARAALGRAARAPGLLLRAQRLQLRLARGQVLAVLAVQRVTVEVASDLGLQALDAAVARLDRLTRRAGTPA